MIWKIELDGGGKERVIIIVAGLGRIQEAGEERSRVLEAKEEQEAHMVDPKSTATEDMEEDWEIFKACRSCQPCLFRLEPIEAVGRRNKGSMIK